MCVVWRGRVQSYSSSACILRSPANLNRYYSICSSSSSLTSSLIPSARSRRPCRSPQHRQLLRRQRLRRRLRRPLVRRRRRRSRSTCCCRYQSDRACFLACLASRLLRILTEGPTDGRGRTQRAPMEQCHDFIPSNFSALIFSFYDLVLD